MAGISLSMIDKYLRSHGLRVSRAAKILMKKYLERELERLSREAAGFAEKEHRKTILERHVEMAIQQKTLIE